VLLCDEATSALDPQTTESILNLLRDINKRLHITIVMITHQMNVVKEICDRVAVIENGEIIEQGSMVDIFTNPQKATTKEFVASIQHNDLPDFVKKLDIHKDYKAGDKALVSLSFIGDSAGEPIVSVLIKEYDTNVNILTANIETLQDTPFGTLLIEVEGDEDHLKKALDYLHERKVKDEVIGYVS
jgi:D-methionine transport system ATP-binding protein